MLINVMLINKNECTHSHSRDTYIHWVRFDAISFLQNPAFCLFVSKIVFFFSDNNLGRQHRFNLQNDLLSQLLERTFGREGRLNLFLFDKITQKFHSLNKGNLILSPQASHQGYSDSLKLW